MGPGRWAAAGRGLTPNPQEEASALGSAVPMPPATSHCVSLSPVALRGQAKAPSTPEGPRYRSPMLAVMSGLLPTPPPAWDGPALSASSDPRPPLCLERLAATTPIL